MEKVGIYRGLIHQAHNEHKGLIEHAHIKLIVGA